tara:strand:- start:2264 stop:3493 length:1230 start_codon:yes stop_codon:yes gene_type:complete
MHLVERYSLGTGAKIGKPFILEKFFPMEIKDYITLQPQGKYESRSYDYWQEVVDILLPVLKENDIDIVQVGGKDERPIKGCYYTSGQASFNQTAYMISNSKLHLGIDSLGVHLASHYGKKIVGLYSVVYPNNSRPFFSKDEDIIILEPEREEGEKPSFSPEESPKTINQISPEIIANSVCDLLEIDFDYPYETLMIGQGYTSPAVDLIPDIVVSWPTPVRVRMDLHFNEDTLFRNLQVNDCIIITNKTISTKILLRFKDKIKKVYYLIEEKNDPEFIYNLKHIGIDYVMISHMEEERLNKFKLDYMDNGVILSQSKSSKKEAMSSSKEIKEAIESKEQLFYKSNKFIISGEDIYPSKYAWESGKPIRSLSYDKNGRAVMNLDKVVQEIPHEDDSIWEDLDYFNILRRKA